MNKTGIAIALIAVLVIGGGVFILTQSSDDAPNTSTTQSTNQSSPSSASEETPANTIVYTDNGFNPETVQTTVGSTITVKNDSSRILQFSSDPHPEHTDEDELNLSSLAPGKSTTFSASRTGTFGFHNHLNEDHTGKLVVQ